MLGTRRISSVSVRRGMTAQRKILVVDDKQVIADTLAKILGTASMNSAMKAKY